MSMVVTTPGNEGTRVGRAYISPKMQDGEKSIFFILASHLLPELPPSISIASTSNREGPLSFQIIEQCYHLPPPALVLVLVPTQNRALLRLRASSRVMSHGASIEMQHSLEPFQYYHSAGSKTLTFHQLLRQAYNLHRVSWSLS
jgi:hypothetical protein